jgi:hypothetical protein
MTDETKKIRLRPVVYTTSYFKRGAQNTAQQMFLLKALQVTQDPKKLKQMIGVKTVAEVYRTLDKLAMRKEYHSALARAGISFDFIVNGIKDIATSGFKDGDRLKAYQTLLKSVGLEKYDSESAGVSGTWEEELLKSIEAQKSKELSSPTPSEPEKYDVKFPEVPESARKAKEEEAEMTSSIYENKK